jgi:hypothetical protein
MIISTSSTEQYGLLTYVVSMYSLIFKVLDLVLDLAQGR